MINPSDTESKTSTIPYRLDMVL